ncbi:MAG: LTA synthase family protein [Anaerovoracaceae bacterium]
MDKLKEIYLRYCHNSLALCVVLALVLNLLIETMARQGIGPGIEFLINSPIVFLYNALIIFATLSIASLFRRRVFLLSMASAVWLGLGITNGVILRNRMTPFTTYDIASLKDGLSIASTYFSKTQMMLGIVGIVLLLIGIILLWKKAPKKVGKINYKRNLAVVVLIIIGTFGVSGLAIETKVVDTFFPNLAYAYRDNGVPYCFINTWLNTGVNKEKDYSEAAVKKIFSEEELNTTVGKVPNNKDGQRPNIIFLQLESLMDPLTIKGMEFSEDPIPNLRKLYKHFPSGRLTVPSVGAGTANTEFEAISGMSVKFFGPGEYPYKSVLTDTTCESIPYNLKDLGYSTHAIHNHRGVFYERNLVFPNLGFDTFTSVEYMNNVTRTPKNWAKDNVLTTQMKDAMKSTKEKDYIYTISVQGHGKYPTEEVLVNPKIRVTKAPDEATKWSFEYYVNQIHEMDNFVADFLSEMDNFGEDVTVVMYGDHLPALDQLTDETLKDGRNTYQTDYVIWSNFKYGGKDKDLFSYQLGAELLDNLGIHNGTIVTHHQKHKDSNTYRKDLQMLQYDMLYGDRFIYNGTTPFKPIDMKMGVKKISVDKIVKIGTKYYIKGKNFTEYSKINLDGKILKTFYLGPTILGLSDEVKPDAVERMKVSQVESKSEILSTTE